MPSPARRSALAAALLLGLVAGCASGDDAAGPAPSPEPLDRTELAAPDAGAPATDAATASSAAELALPATGVLALAGVEGGCAVLEVDGDRYELIAATGADLAVDPANGVIANADGEVVARPGDTITVDGVLDPGMVTFCQVGPVIALESVTPA